MKQAVEEALHAVLSWWEEHKYDTETSEDDEYNVYDEEPRMVTLARQALKAMEKP